MPLGPNDLIRGEQIKGSSGSIFQGAQSQHRFSPGKFTNQETGIRPRTVLNLDQNNFGGNIYQQSPNHGNQYISAGGTIITPHSGNNHESSAIMMSHSSFKFERNAIFNEGHNQTINNQTNQDLHDLRIDMIGERSNSKKREISAIHSQQASDAAEKARSSSLNPAINKRIKSKRIEDPRKQVVLKVKRSLGQMENASNSSIGPFQPSIVSPSLTPLNAASMSPAYLDMSNT